jgi:predicted DNA-binding transcriptional regulator AlpA
LKDDPDVAKTSTTKQPAAQVPFANKAANTKAAGKKPQKVWLERSSLLEPIREIDPPSAPERVRASDRSQAPPRLLDRHDIVELTGVSYPTIWSWMRAGTFPRGRICGGKSMWLSSEVEAWMRALPVRRLKGEAPRSSTV